MQCAEISVKVDSVTTIDRVVNTSRTCKTRRSWSVQASHAWQNACVATYAHFVIWSSPRCLSTKIVPAMKINFC